MRHIHSILISEAIVLHALAIVPVAAGATAAVPGVETITFANGLAATVYTSDYLRDHIVFYSDGPAIQLDDSRFIPVITDINDPSIVNKGDGMFHPYPLDLTVSVLNANEHPSIPTAVQIYLLPYPRRGVLVSSTTGAEMFLSPLVLEVDPLSGAYTIAHELGHVFHNRFMPDNSPAWDDFRRIRGITNTSRYNDGASHAYRPKEIFAEDFRVLFGGPDAYFDGNVENTELVNPETVGGLRRFMVRVAHNDDARTGDISATSSPNPFNPVTELRVSVPPERADRAERLTVRVYTVTGALVRELYAGNASRGLAVRWDGTDRSGNRVASGTYYAAIEVGGATKTLKLVLLK